MTNQNKAFTRHIAHAEDVETGEYVITYWGVNNGFDLIRITGEHNDSQLGIIKTGVIVGGTITSTASLNHPRSIAGYPANKNDGSIGWWLASKEEVLNNLHPEAVNPFLDVSSPEDYKKIMGSQDAKEYYQGALNAEFTYRNSLVKDELRGAKKEPWRSPAGSTLLMRDVEHFGCHSVEASNTYLGSNIVATTWLVDDGTTKIVDDLIKSPREIADLIDKSVTPDPALLDDYSLSPS